MVGFTHRVVLSQVPTQDGTILLFVDRELSLRETTVHVTCPFAVGSNREIYPTANLLEQAAPYYQAFHTDWIGDLTAPVWTPFVSATPVPAQFDLDRYNGIALMNPYFVDNSTDICVTIFEHQRYDGLTVVEQLLPAAI